jgi:hypothetical protein
LKLGVEKSGFEMSFHPYIVPILEDGFLAASRGYWHAKALRKLNLMEEFLKGFILKISIMAIMTKVVEFHN